MLLYYFIIHNREAFHNQLPDSSIVEGEALEV